MGSNVLFVVPARGGSKRLANKNMQIIDGYTLIAHAGGIANDFDGHHMITTDDMNYADEGVRNGLDHWYVRLPSLSDDYASSYEVWQDAFKEAETHYDTEFGLTVLLEPVCPLREVPDVERTISAALMYGLACTVTRAKTAPEKFLTQDSEGSVDISGITNSALLPSNYVLRNGAAYAATRDLILDLNDEGWKHAFPVSIERPLISIHSQFDLDLARFLWGAR